ncbi:unnamed protein product [Arctogadus glacialis]
MEGWCHQMESEEVDHQLPEEEPRHTAAARSPGPGRFWDMLQLSIENISLKFDELHQLKATTGNPWSLLPLSPTPVLRHLYTSQTHTTPVLSQPYTCPETPLHLSDTPTPVLSQPYTCPETPLHPLRHPYTCPEPALHYTPTPVLSKPYTCPKTPLHLSDTPTPVLSQPYTCPETPLHLSDTPIPVLSQHYTCPEDTSPPLDTPTPVLRHLYTSQTTPTPVLRHLYTSQTPLHLS